MKSEHNRNKEQKLRSIIGQLEELKDQLAETTQEYEDCGAEDEVLDLLAEALESVDTAIDAVFDVVNE